MEKLYLDVREADEFNRKHIRGAINIPLNQLKTSIDSLQQVLAPYQVVLVCQSGKRAGVAQGLFPAGMNVEVMTGGMNNYSGADVVIGGGAAIPLFRQVMVTAGLLVLVFSLLGFFVRTEFFYGALFVGCALAFAGLSGFCPMAILLSRMPWNKN